VFFSLMIAGLASSLPGTLTRGLRHLGVPSAAAHQAGALPPVSSLFAAVLGVNPVQHLLAASGALSSLPVASRRILTGREFFPELISGPFRHGLTIVFAVATVLAVVAGVASLLREGGHTQPAADGAPREGSAGSRAHGTAAPAPSRPRAAPADDGAERPVPGQPEGGQRSPTGSAIGP
jgi:hypothetical protein